MKPQKVEVTKPFAQEAELAEKPERLSALNAPAQYGRKGDDALGMDDAPEEENEKDRKLLDMMSRSQEGGRGFHKPETGESAMDVPIPYPVDNAGHNYTVDNGKPQGRNWRRQWLTSLCRGHR